MVRQQSLEFFFPTTEFCHATLFSGIQNRYKRPNLFKCENQNLGSDSQQMLNNFFFLSVVNFQILDATFDDIVPLAIAKMPETLSRYYVGLSIILIPAPSNSGYIMHFVLFFYLKN